GTELQFCLLEQDPFPCQVKVCDVPCLLEAHCGLKRSRQCLGNGLQQFEALPVGLVAIKRRLHRGGEVEHGTRHLQLGLFKLCYRHALAEGEVENVQKIQCRAQIQFGWAAVEQEADRTIEHRVFQ